MTCGESRKAVDSLITVPYLLVRYCNTDCNTRMSMPTKHTLNPKPLCPPLGGILALRFDYKTLVTTLAVCCVHADV